jgi:hypothetical protein
VPIQDIFFEARAHALVENAFEVFCLIFDVNSVVTIGTAKEIRRWQLFRVSHHDELLASGNGSDGVPHRDL